MTGMRTATSAAFTGTFFPARIPVLTPEEISSLNYLRRIEEEAKLAAMWGYGINPERLHDIVEAEKDGRLRILPCKFGTKLWRSELDGTVRQYMVTAVNAQDGIHRRTLVECNPFNRFIWEEDFGKQFFLTMKDAEAELERRKHDRGRLVCVRNAMGD